MKQQWSPESVEWFRQQAMDFARRAAAAPEPVPVGAEDIHTATEAEYRDFLKSHPANGSLKVQVYTARGALPVEKAEVEIAKLFSGNARILYQGTTDSSGILEDIALPALPASYSQSPDTAAQSGTDYQVSVFHPSFREKTAMKVTIFDQILTILPVSLRPQQQ
ncbi:MAG: hypothetical protein PUC59_02025 [Firmicutes bacterium]|nr:hypothetical protein [Bacillota bacterium]